MHNLKSYFYLKHKKIKKKVKKKTIDDHDDMAVKE